MWLFDSPKNYIQMVEKISKSAFFVTLLLLFFFSKNCNKDFSNFLKILSCDIELKFAGIKIYIAIFYIPLIISFLEHAFKLHNIISKLFKIRDIFDKKVIVNEFFRKLNISKNIKDIDKKTCNRIMSKAFYSYASSTKPLIDTHYIYLALGCWCWFWIVIDTFFLVFFMGILFLIISWAWRHLLVFLFLIFLFLVIMLLLLLQSKKYAIDEIREILKDPEKSKEVKKNIEDAL